MPRGWQEVLGDRRVLPRASFPHFPLARREQKRRQRLSLPGPGCPAEASPEGSGPGGSVPAAVGAGLWGAAPRGAVRPNGPAVP